MHILHRSRQHRLLVVVDVATVAAVPYCEQVSGHFLCAKIDANVAHWTIALDFTDIVELMITVSVQFVTQLSELFR